MRALAILACLSIPSLAVAKSASLADRVVLLVSSAFSGSADHEDMQPPRFAFTKDSFAVAPKAIDDAVGGLPDIASADDKKKRTVAVAVDGKTAWVAADLAHYTVCGDETCGKQKPEGWFHATALVEVPSLKPIAWHVAEPISYKDQKLALSKGPQLDALPKRIDPGAEQVVKLFESSLADPRLLAATVSGRKDVVLYGSEKSERYVGSAAVKKTIAKWNLSFKVQNGIQAGLAPSKTVAWVAAHLDAVSAKAPKKPVPYRVLAIYEKAGDKWQLVNAHFSFTWN